MRLWTRARRGGLAVLVLGALLVGPSTAALYAVNADDTSNRAIFFSSDGMRPDLLKRYVQQGGMPTYADLMKRGVTGDNGLEQAFPPNTGVGWYTLATGTWPSEHGSTNNTFHRTGEANFNNSTSFATTGLLQADTIQQSAERAGKTVVSLEWSGSRNLVPALQGP
jgi:predicted AlkP superfamily pyrophosphatase or phosphodiesterase